MLQVGCRRSGAAAGKGERREGRRVKKMRREQREPHERSAWRGLSAAPSSVHPFCRSGHCKPETRVCPGLDSRLR